MRRIKWYALIQAFRALEALGLERSAEWLAHVTGLRQALIDMLGEAH